MSTGSMFGGTCYPTQAQAATAACSTISSFLPDGSMMVCRGLSTTNPSSTTDGGSKVVSLSIAYTSAGGSPTTVMDRALWLYACERYDYEYWSPAITAWVTAIVTIIAAKVLWTRIFSRETL
jgi:hypothetical protein